MEAQISQGNLDSEVSQGIRVRMLLIALLIEANDGEIIAPIEEG